MHTLIKEEEELECNDLATIYMYRLVNSLYSHMYRAYRGQKGETEIRYRKKCNSTTATLVHLHVRTMSKAPILGTDMLCSPSDRRS